jgi:hypothetical protein
MSHPSQDLRKNLLIHQPVNPASQTYNPLEILLIQEPNPDTIINIQGQLDRQSTIASPRFPSPTEGLEASGATKILNRRE